MGHYRRSGRAWGVVFAAITLIGLPRTTAAQPLPYTFTKITDTVATPGVASTSCVGMNDLGTVVLNAGGALLRGRDAASLTVVHDEISTLCPSINDSDEIAYFRRIGTTAQLELVKDASGSETILATTLGSPGISPVKPSYLPSLNNAGHAAYVAGDGTKLAVAPIGTTLTPPDNYVTPASMNDGDVIAFAAPDSSSKAGLYRGSTMPLLQDGDTISGGTISFNYLQRPGVNNSGTVAFRGRLFVGGVGGPNGVFTTDGSSVELVGTNPLDRFSLNDSGSVAFRKNLGGTGDGLYLGRPGLVDQKVIERGDALDGSTITTVFIWEESLNNLGQVAFYALLADGRRGIYVATPKWLNALSFTTKVPACGPVSAKVTLTTVAPPGGLTVDLATTHPSATIPAQVVVPAGKKTVSFSILPTPVLANSRDDIEATHGAQTVSRQLTIRPITVKSVSLTPNPVIGGNAVVGTVKLDCGAQPADLGVTLSSSKPSLAAPTVSSLVIPQGSDSATFDVTTNPVTVSTSATIKASALGTTKSKKLVINP